MSQKRKLAQNEPFPFVPWNFSVLKLPRRDEDVTRVLAQNDRQTKVQLIHFDHNNQILQRYRELFRQQ